MDIGILRKMDLEIHFRPKKMLFLFQIKIFSSLASHRRESRKSTGLRKKPVAGCPPPKGSNLPILPRGREGGREYIPSKYIPHKNTYFVNRDKRVHKMQIEKIDAREADMS